MAKYRLDPERLDNLNDIEIEILKKQLNSSDEVIKNRASAHLKQYKDRSMPAVSEVKYKNQKTKAATGRTWPTIDPDFKLNAKIAQEKIGREALESAVDLKAGATADVIEKYGMKASAAVLAVVGVASVADYMMKNNNKKQVKKQKKIQKDQHDKKQEAALKNRNMGMVDEPFQRGLVQEMFDGRIGHSNSWGGKRY